MNEERFKLQLEFGTAAAFQPESTVDECRCYRVRFPLFKSTATQQRKSIVWQRQLCSSGHLEKRNHNATISFVCFYSGEKFDKFLIRYRNCNWSPIFSSYCCINCKGALPVPLGTLYVYPPSSNRYTQKHWTLNWETEKRKNAGNLLTLRPPLFWLPL